MNKIVTPGIYDGISFDDYHRQALTDAPSISGSGLVLIERMCPAIYWATSALNPKRIDETDTAAMLFGRAFHCLQLEGKATFHERYRVKPEGHDGRTKE